MAPYELLLVDLFNLIYNLTWLMFLTHQHYGQVTTTAGHIFELNVQLNVTIQLLWILFLDMELFPLGITAEILDTANVYNFCAAIACSQIETVVFLKTLNVNTMMTNTAGKIILLMTMFSCGMAVINTFAIPLMTVRQSKSSFCGFLTPREFYVIVIPELVVLATVPLVMGFGVFRGLQLRRTKDSGESPENLNLEELGQGLEIGVRSKDEDTLNDLPSQGRLFTIQAMISELNQVTPREMREEDLVIEDIELDTMDIFPSTDHVMTDEIECVPIPPRDIIEEDLVIKDTELASIETTYSTDHVITNDIGCVPLSPRNIIEEDLAIQDTEFASKETTSSMEHVVIDEIGCVPGLNMVLKTIQKYMKNTMISLLILTLALPWCLASFYAFITNSGCEDPTIKVMVDISEFCWLMLIILLPIMIKLKLDRLSQ